MYYLFRLKLLFSIKRLRVNYSIQMNGCFVYVSLINTINIIIIDTHTHVCVFLLCRLQRHRCSLEPRRFHCLRKIRNGSWWKSRQQSESRRRRRRRRRRALEFGPQMRRHVRDCVLCVDFDHLAFAIDQSHLNGRCRLTGIDRRRRGRQGSNFHYGIMIGTRFGTTARCRGGGATTQGRSGPRKGSKGFDVRFGAFVNETDRDIAFRQQFAGCHAGGQGSQEFGIGRIVQATVGTIVHDKAVAVHGNGTADFRVTATSTARS